MKDKVNEIMEQLTNFCEECPSHTECPEEDCVVFRIEKILLDDTEEEVDNGQDTEMC